MNQEQLNVWKSAAQKSDGLVRIYAEDLLAIIALAERALLAAAPAPIQQDDEDKKAINDMLAYGTGFTVGGRHVPTETVRMFSNPEITSAESSKQMQQPAQLAVATHAGAHSTTVVINLMRDGKATCVYSADHSANGESIGVSDVPENLFCATPPALAGNQVQAAGDAVLEKLIAHISDNWSMKKYTLVEIADGLEVYRAAMREQP